MKKNQHRFFTIKREPEDTGYLEGIGELSQQDLALCRTGGAAQWVATTRATQVWVLEQLDAEEDAERAAMANEQFPYTYTTISRSGVKRDIAEMVAQEIGNILDAPASAARYIYGVCMKA